MDQCLVHPHPWKKHERLHEGLSSLHQETCHSTAHSECAQKHMHKFCVAERGIIVESEVGGEGVASSYPI